MTSLQLKLVKIGARVVRHARAITLQLAEVAVTGPMVQASRLPHRAVLVLQTGRNSSSPAYGVDG
ncbi:hypothetical protein P775_01970 [Puniceibacterium antarcticum]|uniref:Uncharacterized protein n=1 Tax=Puniceibacterium antarcticum TaxID=1206336 RepID=A0A2G8RK90_9RHOB|nr:hypothetical protein P775_01970 [Puniceibacterium antarcticum]